MSEAPLNSINNASGDSGESKISDANTESPTNGAPNNLKEYNESTVIPKICGASGDSNVEKDGNINKQENDEPNAEEPTGPAKDAAKLWNDRGDFRSKLEMTERKLTSLLRTPAETLANGLVSSSEDGTLRSELEDLRNTLAQTKLVLEDRERRIVNQENQISALDKQVTSLKEVVSITKDMLNIRNMEVKHLREDVDKMETKITAERERRSAMLGKMEAAVRLNADLKKEYQTQLQLFQDLRGKYEEKVTILSEENKALEMAVQAQPAQ